MKESRNYLAIRALWSILGFILFYAPFALFQKLLINVFKLSGRTDIHGSCFRMGIQGLFTGKGLNLLTTTGFIIALILVSAFVLGPVFCGHFCLAGALPEYISRIVPDRFKINWQKNIYPAPIRYGVLSGFILSSFLGISVVCSYCNFSLMEKLILGGNGWNLAVLSSASILTGFFWLIFLGAFAKGGRGFCSYLCPIGATQSLIHSIGARFGFTYKLKFTKEKCVSCQLCVKDCPMGAIQSSETGLNYNIHGCITCHQCEHVCPKKALSYGRGESGWLKDKLESPITEEQEAVLR